jgi:hypothetical protein
LHDLFERHPAEFLRRILEDRADFEEARPWLQEPPTAGVAENLLHRIPSDPSAARLAAMLPLGDKDLERLLVLLESSPAEIQDAILAGIREQSANLERAWQRLAPLVLARDRTVATLEALAAVYPYLLKASHSLASSAEQALLGALGDADPELREGALRGLGAAPDRHLGALSRAYAGESSLELRLEIVRLLRGSREFLASAACSDGAPEVRRLAVDLGGTRFGPEDRTWLARRHQIERDPEVLDALARALAALKSR